jgi:hypothetical protein
MSYRIKTRGRVGLELQRVADEELSAAQAELRALGKEDIGEAIHEARKHFKKLRALVQLLKEAIGPKGVREEQTFYRDAGRIFHRLRDAQAQAAALEKLTGRFFEKRRPLVVLAVRRILSTEEQRARRALEKDSVREGVLASLCEARQRVAKWELEDYRWKDLRRSYRRSYRRAREAWRQACGEPKPRLLHDWRRRTKDLYYHLCLAHSAAPDYLDEVTSELEILSEFLGDDHDLVGLRKLIESHRRQVPGGQARDALLEMLALRREELLDAAFDLAGRVLAETPGDFIAILEERRDEHRRLRKKERRVAERLEALG